MRDYPVVEAKYVPVIVPVWQGEPIVLTSLEEVLTYPTAFCVDKLQVIMTSDVEMCYDIYKSLIKNHRDMPRPTNE